MRHAGLLAALLLVGGAVSADAAHAGRQVGRLVGVSIEVDGRQVPLYTDVRQPGRSYLEARYGSAYAIRLRNRTNERLAVALSVDGLNVISGTLAPSAGHGAGRMYVLRPWETATVRGWRTSLAAVQLFTFVEEAESYAVRSGQPNQRLGSIDVVVYRERRPARVGVPLAPEGASADERRPHKTEPRSADAAAAESESRADAAGGRRSFPGTGWGPAAQDPAVVVRFEPEPTPAEALRLRYEERWALARLGVLPPGRDLPDRLREREALDEGFARPPRRD